MHRPGTRIIPGLRPAARPHLANGPGPLAPIVDGVTAGWHHAFAERLRGPLDLAALRAALDAVTARQDALRYRIGTGPGSGSGSGSGPLNIDEVTVEDLSGLPTWQRGAALDTRLAALAGTAFDPTDRLWRATLYRLDPDEHVLAIAWHRAVFDSHAQALFYADLATAYALARAGAPADLPPLPTGFVDYVTWRGAHANRRGQLDLAWWATHLNGVATRLELPTDPSGAAPAGSGFAATLLGSAATAGVGGLARGLGATPAAVLLAALGVVLGRLSGQADFVVGTPLAGLRPPGFEPVIGSLFDIAPLRLRPDLATSFASQVRQVRDELLDACAHPAAGLSQVVDALRLAGPGALVQVLFEMADGAAPVLELAGLSAEPVPVAVPTPAPVELTIRGVLLGDRLRIEAAYDPGRYRPERVSALLDTLGQVVAHAVTSPDRAVGEFALRPDDQPAPDRDHAVLDWLGRRAGVGELGEIAARWAGGWHGTGQAGRYSPDGTVEPAQPTDIPVAHVERRPPRLVVSRQAEEIPSDEPASDLDGFLSL